MDEKRTDCVEKSRLNEHEWCNKSELLKRVFMAASDEFNDKNASFLHALFIQRNIKKRLHHLLLACLLSRKTKRNYEWPCNDHRRF